MTEIDILNLFYQEMKTQGVTRDVVFLNIDEATAAKLSAILKTPITLEEARRLTDICIANEWIERTTADPGYNFLSLTQAGLQVMIADEYTPPI